jgi:DNA-directed RNA polymerase-3 subunit RPC5
MATGDKTPSLDADVDMGDLASLDASAATSAAAAGAPSTRFRPRAKGKPRPKPEPRKPVPVAVPKLEPEPVPVREPDVNPAVLQEDAMEVDRAVEVDGSGDAPGLGDGADEEDFVVREIDVYFNPKPLDDDAKVMSRRTRPCCLIIWLLELALVIKLNFAVKLSQKESGPNNQAV